MNSIKAKLLGEPAGDHTQFQSTTSATYVGILSSIMIQASHLSPPRQCLVETNTVHYREPALNLEHAPATHSTNFPGADKTFRSRLWKFISWFLRRLRTKLLPTPAVGCPLNFQLRNKSVSLTRKAAKFPSHRISQSESACNSIFELFPSTLRQPPSQAVGKKTAHEAATCHE